MIQCLDTWYSQMLDEIASSGHNDGDKLSMYGESVRIGSTKPLLRLKPTPYALAIKELAWFIGYDTDYASLEAAGVTWWRPWVQSWSRQMYERGRMSSPWQPGESLKLSSDDLPYLRHHGAYCNIVDNLTARRHRPLSWSNSRNYATLWDNDLIANDHDSVLPPCALAYQLFVEDGLLHMAVTQRSADLICGVPSNIAQYAWLLHVYAGLAGLLPGWLQFNYGSLHVYKAHVEHESFLELSSPKRLTAALALPETDVSPWLATARLQQGLNALIDSTRLIPKYKQQRLDAVQGLDVIPVHCN